jgi:hypothetical protein
MGFSFGALVFGAVKAAAGIYRTLKGSGEPVTLGNALPLALPQILTGVQDAVSSQSLTTKEKIDSWIGTVDSLTGSDPAALDLVPGLPAEAEEELFDALLTVAKVLAYQRAGVPGYVESTGQ